MTCLGFISSFLCGPRFEKENDSESLAEKNSKLDAEIEERSDDSDHRTAAESRPGSGIRVIWPGLRRAERGAATPQLWRAEEAAGPCSPHPGECCPTARGRAVLRHVLVWDSDARQSGPLVSGERAVPRDLPDSARESSPPAAHRRSCLSPAACGRAVPRRAREVISSQRAGEFHL